jgi:hypothetical protein
LSLAGPQNLKSNTEDGSLLSYREVAVFIGKPHSTVRTWMMKYFPKVTTKMGGVERGNREAEPPPVASLHEEHRAAVYEAVQSVSQRFNLLTPEARWEVVRLLEKARDDAVQLGLNEPPAADF